MKPITRCLHTRVAVTDARPAVTPLYQASAFEAGSPFFYTRKSNPNCCEFEETARELEGARHGVALASGMAAIRVCLEQVRPGELIVLNQFTYGCTFKLMQRFAKQFNIRLQILDLTSEQAVQRIPDDTRLIFFETPTNPFLRTVDIAQVSNVTAQRCPAALIVVDNTWATPLYQQPLTLGAHVSVHSATKYMSGHSDVMAGVLLTDRDDLAEAFRQERFYSGAILDPYAAWLLRRSMQTFGVRVERQARIAAEMCSFLQTLPQVSEVYYPDIDGTQLRGYPGIIFVELRSDLVPYYQRLVEALQFFGSGTGMACVTSMIAQPYTGSHASMTDAEKESMGLGRSLVRLCFGLEDPEDLRTDLQQAFASLEPLGSAAKLAEAAQPRVPVSRTV